jgi:hypothetical protein
MDLALQILFAIEKEEGNPRAGFKLEFPDRTPME